MTPKQAIFYGEFIKDGNATRSARVAGSSEKSAHVDGCRMLKNAKVAAAIAGWRERQQVKYEITADRVLQELHKLATWDAKNLYDAEGNRIPIHLLDDVTRAAVAGVEDEETERTVLEAKAGATPEMLKTVKRIQRPKMADKGQNLERLGKYFKLFSDSTLSASVTAGASGLAGGSEITVTLVRPG